MNRLPLKTCKCCNQPVEKYCPMCDGYGATLTFTPNETIKTLCSSCFCGKIDLSGNLVSRYEKFEESTQSNDAVTFDRKDFFINDLKELFKKHRLSLSLNDSGEYVVVPYIMKIDETLKKLLENS